MAIYFNGSKDGTAIKVGYSKGLLPNGRYQAQAINGHRLVELPFPLGYATTIGGNDKHVESCIKRYFRNALIDEKRHGDEIFHAQALLPYVTWFRMQWFAETDPSGTTVPEAVDCDELMPSHERVSDARREEDLTSAFEAEANPFWFLPDVTVEPNEDFFTPKLFVDRVRAAFGGVIDLDVASHPRANRTVGAESYYTKSMNGLALPWFGRVWLSPRTNDMEAWVEKAIFELDNGRVDELICLIHSRAEASVYYQPMLRLVDAICVISGGGPVFEGRGALTANNPADRWHFNYFGKRTDRFVAAMSQIGTCFRKV